MKIESILEAINSNKLRVTDHADEEMFADKLILKDVLQSVGIGEIIEDYPNDKPFPSCLVYGKNELNQPIHSVWGFNPKNSWAVLITVYRPNPKKWIDWKKRKKNDSI